VPGGARGAQKQIPAIPCLGAALPLR
jgi:hypothetical protein